MGLQEVVVVVMGLEENVHPLFRHLVQVMLSQAF